MFRNLPGIHVKKYFYLIVLQMCVFVQVCAGTLMYSCQGSQGQSRVLSSRMPSTSVNIGALTGLELTSEVGVAKQ